HHGRRRQQVAEFTLLADSVARGNPPRLRALASDERGFLHLFAHSFDQVDGTGVPTPNYPTGPRHVTLETCHTCHASPGLNSVNSVMFVHPRPAQLQFTVVPPTHENQRDAHWKTTRAEWGALRALSLARNNEVGSGTL
ncbi:MAG TPA: hypothetical protein VHF69_12165, partial [Candidatus Synoicihabitans sp.]|nr:hypothetical protein [Candidatus Synoicihabitans sp.]